MSESSLKVRRITLQDDLVAIADSIIGDEWGDDNDMDDYDADAIKEFVSDSNNVLLVAYMDGQLAGCAIAMKLLKPYREQNWLYVDEVDVKPEFRRRGIGRALMKQLFVIARDWGLEEVWLGTEPDNTAANVLYKSLQPDKTEQFTGYTFKIRAKEAA